MEVSQATRSTKADCPVVSVCREWVWGLQHSGSGSTSSTEWRGCRRTFSSTVCSSRWQRLRTLFWSRTNRRPRRSSSGDWTGVGGDVGEGRGMGGEGAGGVVEGGGGAFFIPPCLVRIFPLRNERLCYLVHLVCIVQMCPAPAGEVLCSSVSHGGQLPRPREASFDTANTQHTKSVLCWWNYHRMLCFSSAMGSLTYTLPVMHMTCLASNLKDWTPRHYNHEREDGWCSSLGSNLRLFAERVPRLNHPGMQCRFLHKIAGL